jgi:hypothetical protein
MLVPQLPYWCPYWQATVSPAPHARQATHFPSNQVYRGKDRQDAIPAYIISLFVPDIPWPYVVSYQSVCKLSHLYVCLLFYKSLCPIRPLSLSLSLSLYPSHTHTHARTHTHVYIQALIFTSEIKLCKASTKTWLSERHEKQAADAYREILMLCIYVQKV